MFMEESRTSTNDWKWCRGKLAMFLYVAIVIKLTRRDSAAVICAASIGLLSFQKQHNLRYHRKPKSQEDKNGQLQRRRWYDRTHLSMQTLIYERAVQKHASWPTSELLHGKACRLFEMSYIAWSATNITFSELFGRLRAAHQTRK